MSPHDARAMLALCALGVLGAVSFCPVAPDLVRRVLPAGRQLRTPTWALVLLTLLQTSLVVAVCAWVGARLGPPLGLRSGLLDQTGLTIWSAFARLALPGVAFGAAGALVAFLLAKPLVGYLRGMPLTVRLLYGGFTEEVIARWGLMTFVVWLLSSAMRGHVTAGWGEIMLAGIVITNAVFAAAHIPLLRAVKTTAPGRAAAIIFVVSLPWGWLFRAFGIESAMIAHMTFHAVVEAVAMWKKKAPEVEY
ncbi:MAG: CPBP family glutamic-type intramembrane protease [Acidobacteriota bacterium]|nr:CPBP family glutamic-type intramembrane protease [Acidobacteriota bacterium]